MGFPARSARLGTFLLGMKKAPPEQPGGAFDLRDELRHLTNFSLRFRGFVGFTSFGGSGSMNCVIPRFQHSAQTCRRIAVPSLILPSLTVKPLYRVRLVQPPQRLHINAPSSLRIRLMRSSAASPEEGSESLTRWIGMGALSYRPASLNASASRWRSSNKFRNRPFCVYMSDNERPPSRNNRPLVGPRTSSCLAADC